MAAPDTNWSARVLDHPCAACRSKASNDLLIRGGAGQRAPRWATQHHARVRRRWAAGCVGTYRLGDATSLLGQRR